MKPYVRSCARRWKGPQRDPDSIVARNVKVGNTIVNTECSTEVALGTSFIVTKIEHKPSQFHSFNFHVNLCDGTTAILHYNPYEPVGKLIS